MSVEVLRSPLLAGFRHGFLGRRGGVSTGMLQGLNVGTGSSDHRAAIDENRLLASEAIAPGAELVTLHQVHSADVVVAERAWPVDARPHGDGLVSNRRGLLLGILTADCAPVLFADEAAGVVGAAHAGWRGALSGVTDSTIAAMERLGALRSRIVAAIGPCIAQSSYEVDTAFRANLEAAAPENLRFFTDGPAGTPRFDLPAYVAHRLRQAGVGAIEVLGLDTYADPDRFYSFRRATHRGEADYGRQLSAIALP